MFKFLIRRAIPLLALGAVTLSSCVIREGGGRYGHHDRGYHGRGHHDGGYGYGR